MHMLIFHFPKTGVVHHGRGSKLKDTFQISHINSTMLSFLKIELMHSIKSGNIAEVLLQC